MKRIICALFLFVLTSVPAFAQTPLEHVRYLLDQGDIDGLEHEMSALNDLFLAGGSAKDLREIHSRLFETTHPDRVLVVADWVVKYPKSPFAVTAQAWAAISETEQWGNDYDRYARPALAESRLKWEAARMQSLDLIDLALEASDNYLPALDAWLRAREFKPHSDYLATISDALIDIAPTRTSVRLIIEATNHNALKSRPGLLEVCLTYAARAKDYDQDLCVIEAAITYHIGNDIRAIAIDALAEVNDDRLDWARLDIMLSSHTHGTLLTDETLILHTKILNPESDLIAYMRDARRIAHFAERPDYLERISKQVFDHVELRLADDPLNRALLQYKAEFLLEAYMLDANPEDLAAARSAWENTMAYGKSNAQIWRLGARLAIADRAAWDFSVQQVFLENTIAYSGQNVQYLLENVYALNNAKLAAQVSMRAGIDVEGPDPSLVWKK